MHLNHQQQWKDIIKTALSVLSVLSVFLVSVGLSNRTGARLPDMPQHNHGFYAWGLGDDVHTVYYIVALNFRSPTNHAEVTGLRLGMSSNNSGSRITWLGTRFHIC